MPSNFPKVPCTFDPLNFDNYDAWKTVAMAYLIANGCFTTTEVIRRPRPNLHLGGVEHSRAFFLLCGIVSKEVRDQLVSVNDGTVCPIRVMQEIRLMFNDEELVVLMPAGKPKSPFHCPFH